MTHLLTLLLLSSTGLATPTSSEITNAVAAYRAEREQRIVDDFVEFLRIPNVASDADNIRRNARHIQGLLNARGITTQLLEIEGAPPVVFGELVTPGAERTVMIYVHYDGQPVDPDNWASAPWTPVLRDGLVEAGGRQVPLEAPFDPEWRLFARSAGDDKAPIIALVHALDAIRALGVEPGVNLKFFFEGEEEAGSPHLRRMLERYAARLAADLWLFCDGPMHQTRRPQLAYGVRGVTGFDVTVYGPIRPLHSGHYGNWAPNPVAMLNHLLVSMRSDDGRALIEGFYDQVREPTPEELAAVEAIPRVDLALQKDLALGRTEGTARLERAIMSPALNYRGIHAGGVGDSARNIIVPEATASVGIRLVPDQTPARLRTVVENHIRRQGYHVVDQAPAAAVRAEHERVALVRWSDGYPAVRTSLDNPIARDIAAILNAWSGDRLVQLPTMGGSLPLYHIREVLGAPVIILPIANHDNNQHGENENIRLKNLWDAIEIYAALIAGL